MTTITITTEVKLVKSINSASSLFGTGSTVSFNLSISDAPGRERPAGAGVGRTASQYSPCTKTLPSGASSRDGGADLADHPLDAGLDFVPPRAHDQREQQQGDGGERQRDARAPCPSGCASPGTGLSISITAPSTSATRAARSQNAMRSELGFQHEHAKPASSSAAPSQLIGSTESAERPSSTRIAPITPGAISPGEENST